MTLDPSGRVPRSTPSRCPGAFELPLAAHWCAESGRFAGVACLGAVIRGETSHYEHVCAEAARGVQEVQLETGVPCAFGVITCETMEQALARSGGDKRDQGRNAAERGDADGAVEGAATIAHLMAKVCHSCGKGPGVRKLAQPLDGRDQASLQPEPAEGPDRRPGSAPVASTSAPAA